MSRDKRSKLAGEGFCVHPDGRVEDESFHAEFLDNVEAEDGLDEVDQTYDVSAAPSSHEKPGDLDFWCKWGNRLACDPDLEPPAHLSERERSWFEFIREEVQEALAAGLQPYYPEP